MKKLILSLFASIALLSTSCTNDETAKNPINGPQDVAAVYTSTGAVLKVSDVACELSGGDSVVVSGKDLAAMKIVLPAKVVPGEGVLSFDKVAFSAADGSFTGKIDNDERTLAIAGFVRNKQIFISVSPTYKSGLVGVYNFEVPQMKKAIEEGMLDEDTSRVMICKVETPTGKVQFFFGEQEQEYMDVFFNGMIGQGILRSYMPVEKTDGTVDTIYCGALRNITFHADGNLTAEYNKNFTPSFMGMGGEPKMPDFVASPMGAMRWYVKGDKLFLVPNLNAMTKGITSDGIALNLTMKDGKVTVFADKSQIEPVFSMLLPFVPAIPDEVFGDFAMMAKTIIGELVAMPSYSTRFDMGVCFAKSEVWK